MFPNSIAYLLRAKNRRRMRNARPRSTEATPMTPTIIPTMGPVERPEEECEPELLEREEGTVVWN